MKSINSYLKVIGGETQEILNYCGNYKELILMNVYFGFAYDHFLQNLPVDLQKFLPQSEFDEHIYGLIIYSDFEFYQNIKTKIPKWLMFHFLDILYDKESLPRELIEDQVIRTFDFNVFLQNLITIQAPYTDILNYLKLYDSRKNFRSFYSFLEITCTRAVIQRFNYYEKNKTKENRKDLKMFIIKMIKDDLFNLGHTLKLCNSLAKIAFNSFFDLGNYKASIECLFMNPEEEKDIKLIDRFFYLILSKNALPEKYKNLVKISEVKNHKLEFLKRLVKFMDIFVKTSRVN